MHFRDIKTQKQFDNYMLHESMEQRIERYAVLGDDVRLAVLRDQFESGTVTFTVELINNRLKESRSKRAQGKLSRFALEELAAIEELLQQKQQKVTPSPVEPTAPTEPAASAPVEERLSLLSLLILLLLISQ